MIENLILGFHISFSLANIFYCLLGVTLGTVVGVYMAGLALGARLGGRAADRRRGASLLRLYGLLEGAVALTALAVPSLLSASEPLYRTLWHGLGSYPVVYSALRAILVRYREFIAYAPNL